MYRYSNGQISLTDFKQPAGMQLKEDNRWVKKAQTIPWNEIEKPACGAVHEPKRERRETVAACAGSADHTGGIRIQR